MIFKWVFIRQISISLQAGYPHTTSLMLWTTKHLGKRGWKLAKQSCNIDVVEQTLISNALSEDEISAIPCKNKPHNDLHIMMQKEAVMWTYIWAFFMKQYNLIRGSPSPTLHRSPLLWPDQHYWNNLAMISPSNSFGKTQTVLFSCYSYPVAFTTWFGCFYCTRIIEFLSSYLQDEMHIGVLTENFCLLTLRFKPTTFEIDPLAWPAAYSAMQCCPPHCRRNGFVNLWDWDGMMED